MKKITLALLFTVVMFNANAQSFGIKGGFNFANLNGDNTDDFNVLTAYNVGVLCEIKFAKHFAFQPELLYSVQGAKVNDDKIKLNYFTVPLMLKGYITEGFNIQAGPQFAMLISESKNFKPYDSETFDFGFTGGLEFFVTDGLFLQARYYHGTKDVSDHVKIRNEVVQASIGYIF